MTELCVDSTAVQIPQITSNIIRPNGEFTLSSIDGLVNSYQSAITENNFSNTPLNQVVKYYGNESLYIGTGELNSFLKKPEVIAILPNYPELQNRVKTNVFITPLEYAEFITQFLYTPSSFSTAMTIAYASTAKQLNDYYSGNFSTGIMGNFCMIAGGVFGVVGAFFNIIGSFDLAGLLSKIKNLNATALIMTLKKKVIEAIEKTIDRVKDIIEKFNPANIIGQIETFVNEKVIGRIAELKDAAMRFFSKENIDKLKSKISGLIDYAVGVFENPDIEEVLFLIQRFCGFINAVETSLNSLRSPMDNYANNYRDALRITSARSLGNTARAVAGGAIRFDSETRRFQGGSIRQTYTDAGNPPPINAADIEGVTPYNQGRGDSRISFGPGLQPGKMGEEGWTRVAPEARIRLMRVQEIFGRKLIVNSGYRSPAYNARIGGARRSQHMSGNAMDITWNGINIQNREEFIRIAVEQGFRGIGRYGTRFVHVDIGQRREWSG
jgi:hypothetical protein